MTAKARQPVARDPEFGWPARVEKGRAHITIDSERPFACHSESLAGPKCWDLQSCGHKKNMPYREGLSGQARGRVRKRVGARSLGDRQVFGISRRRKERRVAESWRRGPREHTPHRANGGPPRNPIDSGGEARFGPTVRKAGVAKIEPAVLDLRHPARPSRLAGCLVSSRDVVTGRNLVADSESGLRGMGSRMVRICNAVPGLGCSRWICTILRFRKPLPNRAKSSAVEAASAQVQRGQSVKHSWEKFARIAPETAEGVPETALDRRGSEAQGANSLTRSGLGRRVGRKDVTPLGTGLCVPIAYALWAYNYFG